MMLSDPVDQRERKIAYVSVTAAPQEINVFNVTDD
jgi:hypothetical protein